MNLEIHYIKLHLYIETYYIGYLYRNTYWYTLYNINYISVQKYNCFILHKLDSEIYIVNIT